MLSEIIQAVEECGFDEHKEMSSSELIFTKDVVDACLKCRNSGKNYSCPPLSGSLEENIQRVLKYDHAMLINKIIPMPDSIEGYEQMNDQIKSSIGSLRKKLEAHPVEVRMGGGCDICEECGAVTGVPCRFPDKVRYSMEGCGMDICSMAKKFEMTYNAGSRGLGFFFLVLF